MSSYFRKLIESYDKYYESSVNTRRFKYEDVTELIQGQASSEKFSVDQVGSSFEGRSIYCVQWGEGPVKILMWSQMHGDESTATRALFDIWNFLGNDKDNYDSLRNDLYQKVSLYFVPVLNPDGTNQWQRRTLQDIDMNRDAVRLQTPEALILRMICDQVKPLFGFNLHDQSIYYSAGYNDKPATISFLAPAYNKEKEINEVRERAMQMIGYMNQQIQELHPGHVGKYDDTYNPRAFGDNIQKWGISTILIESGGYPNDPEKEYIRKLNFGIILDGVIAAAYEYYKDVDMHDYEKIPFNNSDHFFDLIIRNAAIKRNGREYKVDVAINREETDYNNHRNFYYTGKIAEIGDMSFFYGYEEIDINGRELEVGRVYPFVFDTHEEAREFDMDKVLQNGYTSIIVSDAIRNEQFTLLPVNIINKEEENRPAVALNGSANLVVKDAGEVKMTIVNGFIYKPAEENRGIPNALVRTIG